jgi:hypothetical protein
MKNEIEKIRKGMNMISLKELKSLKIESLENHPDLRRRLKNYILINYESDAIVDENHLIMEFKLLKQNSKLSELYRGEAG